MRSVLPLPYYPTPTSRHQLVASQVLSPPLPPPVLLLLLLALLVSLLLLLSLLLLSLLNPMSSPITPPGFGTGHSRSPGPPRPPRRRCRPVGDVLSPPFLTTSRSGKSSSRASNAAIPSRTSAAFLVPLRLRFVVVVMVPSGLVIVMICSSVSEEWEWEEESA